MRNARWSWPVLAAAVAVAAAGCGGHGTSAAAGSSTPVRPTITVTTSAGGRTATVPPSTSAPPTTSAPRPASGPAPCTAAQLAITERIGGAASEHDGVVLLFRNTGTGICTLHGYPGAAGLDSTGHQATQAQRTPSGYLGGLQQGQTAPTVALAAGRTASALVEGIAVPAGTATSCPALSGLLVTAPGTHHSANEPYAPPDCRGLQVHPVVPGTTGRAG